MLRAVVYIFLAIILISLIRSVIGVLGKGVAALFSSEQEQQQAAAGEPRLAGELKRDPVCGTYVSTATSIKKTVGKQVVHFCSDDCCRKFQA